MIQLPLPLLFDQPKKNAPARPAVHRAGAKAAEAAREKQSADKAACQGMTKLPPSRT